MRQSIKNHEYFNKELPALMWLDKLNSDMRSLQTWRRRCMLSQQKIRAVARLIIANDTTSKRAQCWTLLKEDYEHIAANMDECGRRLEEMLPVVTSLVQIVDSRQSFVETTNIGRLTSLALFFVPLAFVSSLFSMGASTLR